jgi:phage anti-repressor protein
MIQNIVTGSSFAGIVKYAQEKDGSETLDSNLASRDWNGRAIEMDAVASMNTRTTQPVCHVSLSASPGEKPTDQQWITAAQTWRQEMGFTDQHQYVLIKHTDRDHAHVHLIMNRVPLEGGKSVSMSNNYERGEQACRKAEREAGMQSFHEHQAQTGKGTAKGRMVGIRVSIDRSLDGKPGLDLFKSRMQREGFDVIENRSATTGRLSGLSFQSLEDGKTWKGSQIGKGYSAGNLKKRGLDLDGDREHSLLKRDKLKSLKPSRASNRILGKMGAPKIPLPAPLRLLGKVAKAGLSL